MAGERIFGLFPTSTPPTGAVLPVDAEGLGAALKITPKDLVEAVLYVELGTDALTNRNNLINALNAYAASGHKRGTIWLPKGVYEVDNTVTLTAAHSGLTIEGDGCTLYRVSGFTSENSVINVNLSTLLDPMGRADVFTRGPAPNQFQFPLPPEPQPRYPNYQELDAIILFKLDNLGGGRQPIQQVAVITNKNVATGTITVDAVIHPEANAATYLYNGRKLEPGGVDAGATTLTIPGEDARALFPKQSWIFVTDGVGEREAYGEFVRVLGADMDNGDTVLTLESALRNSYLTGRAAVVPPSPDPATGLRSRWGEDITIRGLTFGGSNQLFPNNSNADLGAKFCVNLTLERVRCVLAVSEPNVTSNGMIITTSGLVTLRGCEMVQGGQRLAMNGVRDVWVENSRLGTSLEEFSSDVTFLGCQIIEKYNHRFGTARVKAINCWFSKINEFRVGDDCGLYGCYFYGLKTDGAGSLGIGSNRFTAQDLDTVAGPMRLIFQGGTGHYVGRVRGSDPDNAVVTVVAGSGGRIDGPVTDGTVTAESGGSIPIPGSWTYTTDVQIPLTFPPTPTPVVLGQLAGFRPAMWLRVHLLVAASGVSIARTYEITRGYQTAPNWYVCQPLSEGRLRYENTDFALELYDGGFDAWLRLRRTGGTVDVEVIVRIETNATFTPGGTAPTGAAAGVHESTTVWQRNGLAFMTSPVVTRVTAPADGDLKAQECALWYDSSDTTPRLAIRGKTDDGSFANAFIALTPEP